LLLCKADHTDQQGFLREKFDSETTADLLIWLRDEVLGENDWSALSEQIASNMKQINESYFKKVLSIVE